MKYKLLRSFTLLISMYGVLILFSIAINILWNFLSGVTIDCSIAILDEFVWSDELNSITSEICELLPQFRFKCIECYTHFSGSAGSIVINTTRSSILQRKTNVWWIRVVVCPFCYAFNMIWFFYILWLSHICLVSSICKVYIKECDTNEWN